MYLFFLINSNFLIFLTIKMIRKHNTKQFQALFWILVMLNKKFPMYFIIGLQLGLLNVLWKTC